MSIESDQSDGAQKSARELFEIVKHTRINYFRHFLRDPKYEILKLLINGNVEVKRSARWKKRPHG